ncbi:MAG: DUF4214 domain-containing protein [Thalassovita sp.]
MVQRFDSAGAKIGDEVYIGSDSSEAGQLLAQGNGVYTLVADDGATFDPSATWDWFESIRRPTKLGSEGETNFTGSFGYGDDAIGDGTGFYVAVISGVSAPRLSFWNAKEIGNSQSGTFPDGTPVPSTIWTQQQSDTAVNRTEVQLRYNGQDRPDGVDFTPTFGNTGTGTAAILPNGNIVVAWTAVSGGTSDLPEFSLFAATVSHEGVILSDSVVIAEDVQGSRLSPPFIAAGTDGKVFIGWTGTTDRNGEGTIELKGGVFDPPMGGTGRTFGTDNADTITGTAPAFAGEQSLETYLFDGDDVWHQGASEASRGVFGMEGNDRFVITDASQHNRFPLYGGIGRDIIDFSSSSTAFAGNVSVTISDQAERNTSFTFEVAIGSNHADTFQAPTVPVHIPSFDHTAQPLPFLHTEGGDDTILVFGNSIGGILDGGTGNDLLRIQYQDRSQFELTFNGDHYILGYLFDDFGRAATPYVRPGNELIIRSIETIEFRDQTLTLQQTASAPSGGVGSAGGTANPGVDADQILLGSATVVDTLTGGTGNDLLLGDGHQAIYTEESAAQVYRLYQATLDRNPDRAGQIAWSNSLESGERSLQGVAAGFTGSLEFQSTYGALADTGFVDLLYQNVLGRAADAGGLATWTGGLAAGMTRAEVVIGFSESQEFVTSTQNAAAAFARDANPANWTDEVFRLYQATLDRNPDEGGMLNWTKALSEGRPLLDVIEGFTGSQEFQNTYGSLSDSNFVELLYQNVLDREADAMGLDDWTGRLASGTARSEVVRGFSESAEFVSNTTPTLTAWVRAQGIKDFLTGDAGDDILGGGQMSDAFVFDVSHKGTDQILDLEAWDSLQFNGFGYATPSQVRDLMNDANGNVTFADQGVEVIIEGWSVAQITDEMISL